MVTTENNENRARAKKNGDKTYRGARGNTYLTENNRWVCTKMNSKGEDVIVDMKTGREYYNLTKEKKRKAEEEYKKQGKTVRFKVENECRQHYYGKYRQMYGEVDIETQVPVKTIIVNGMSFYMSLKTGYLLRLEDNARMENRVGNLPIEDIIKAFNKRQDLIMAEHSEEIIWMGKNYFFQGLQPYIYIDSKGGFNTFCRYSYKEYYKYLENDGLVYDKEERRWK